MREIALFGEDFAHEQVIGALVRRLADAHGIDVRLDWRSAVRGHGRVGAGVLNSYLRDLTRQGGRPDLIIVATDANCSGLNERVREIGAPGRADIPDSCHSRPPYRTLAAARRRRIQKRVRQRLRCAGSEVQPRSLQTTLDRSHPRHGRHTRSGRESSSPKTSCNRWTSSAPCGPTAPWNVSSTTCEPSSGSGGGDGLPGCPIRRGRLGIADLGRKLDAARHFNRPIPRSSQRQTGTDLIEIGSSFPYFSRIAVRTGQAKPTMSEGRSVCSRSRAAANSGSELEATILHCGTAGCFGWPRKPSASGLVPLFDPYVAVHASRIETPLPHQITRGLPARCCRAQPATLPARRRPPARARPSWPACSSGS